MAVIRKYAVPLAERIVVNTPIISALLRYEIVEHGILVMWFMEPSDFDIENIKDDLARRKAAAPVPWTFLVFQTDQEIKTPHKDLSYTLCGSIAHSGSSEFFLFRMDINSDTEGLARA